ncbi:F-box protein SKIP23-like protein [Carex littledalei]|uniref:F-box protein SKIP23-like protein n=1 Tax=Carex littledalei TaxID=544730 RepID=A0A833VLY4_9POAL|nr:F-box protein SKIP23-like protein [Carex littledalei]
MASWTDLPSDLLISISDRLDILSCLRCSAVCTTWASTIRPRLPTLPLFCLEQPIPWLLLYAGASKYDPDHTDFIFYNLTTATSYCIPSLIPFSSIERARFLGSNSGWLVCTNIKYQLHLISPLTGTKHLLPCIKRPHGYQGDLTVLWGSEGNSFNWDSLEKVIICRVNEHCSGSDTGLLLLGLFWPHGLAVLKVGDDKWTWLDLKRHYKDALIYRGKIYAMATHTLCCWKLEGCSFRAEKALTIRNSMLNSLTKYLVEYRGKLMMVCRDSEWRNPGNKIRVYNLDLDHRDRLWSPVNNIGDNAVFIGPGYSRIASIVGLHGIQGNCIYYTDDHYAHKLNCCGYRYHNSGIYNLKKGTYEPFPIDYIQPPIWFWPCDVKQHSSNSGLFIYLVMYFFLLFFSIVLSLIN